MGAIVKLWRSEPVAILTVLVIVANTVAQAVGGGLDWTTAIQDIGAAVAGLIARANVTPAKPPAPAPAPPPAP